MERFIINNKLKVSVVSVGLLVCIFLVTAMGASPHSPVSKGEIVLEVSPPRISFFVDDPEFTNQYYATQELTVISYHVLEGKREWNIFLDPKQDFLIGPKNRKIPISRLEWSVDGVNFKKMKHKPTLVIKHQGLKKQLFEDTIYYRITLNGVNQSGSYMTNISYDADWAEVDRDRFEKDVR